jgi:hypothetical protein
MKTLKTFEAFINEAQVTIEATHDFKSNNEKGSFKINGKAGNYKGEEDTTFVDALATQMGVTATDLEKWFYDKFDFNILRASEIDLTGTTGNLATFKGDAYEMN